MIDFILFTICTEQMFLTRTIIRIELFNTFNFIYRYTCLKFVRYIQLEKAIFFVLRRFEKTRDSRDENTFLLFTLK